MTNESTGSWLPVIIGIAVGVAFLVLFGMMFESIVPLDQNHSSSPQTRIRQPKTSIVTIPENASLPGINFEPAIIKVIIGTNNTVKWVNQDTIQSSVVADDSSDPDFYNATNPKCESTTGSENCVIITDNKVNLLMPGKSYEFTFTRPGVFGYHSVPHPLMKGTVIVEQPLPIDAPDRVAKNKQHLAKAQTIFAKRLGEDAKIVEYEKEKEATTDKQEIQELNNKIDASSKEIQLLDQQLNEVEKLNQELYKQEPKMEQRLYAAEKILLDKYTSPSSGSYVGENPVEVVQADLLTRTIVIVVNPDKVTPDGSNIPPESEIDGFPVQIEFGKIQLV